MEFPKYIYLKKDNRAVRVNNQTEQERHGELGKDYAYKVWPQSEVIDERSTPAAPCESCKQLTAALGDAAKEKQSLLERFDAKWKELTEAHSAKIAEANELAEKLAANAALAAKQSDAAGVKETADPAKADAAKPAKAK